MPDIWDMLATIGKLTLYAGFCGATGLVIVRILFEELTPPLWLRMQKQAAALATLGLIAAGFSFSLRGASLTGDAGGMVDAEMLNLLWQTAVGDALIYRVIGGMVLLFGLFLGQGRPWISLLGGAVGLWSFTVVGHVPELEQIALRLLLFLHLLGVSLWVGVLSPLRQLSLDETNPASAAEFGERFGQLAIWFVPGLIAIGAIMAWLLLGGPSALLHTQYGQGLLLKIALVSAMLAVAAANKLRFVPALRRAETGAGRRLARAIEVEAVVFILVFATTARLTSTLTLPG